jgi:Zn-dependent metalloprotease
MAGVTKKAPTEMQQSAIKAMFQQGLAKGESQAEVYWNELGTPAFIRGQFQLRTGFAKGETGVIAFLDKYKDAFKLHDVNKELSLKTVISDDQAFDTYRFQQMYQGVPVNGGELLVHVKNASMVTAINGRIFPDIDVDPNPYLDKNAIIDLAIKMTDATKFRWEDPLAEDLLDKTAAFKSWYPDPKLEIFYKNNQYYLVYHVMIAVDKPEPANWEYFIDAQTGELIHKRNSLYTGATTGSGVLVNGQTVTLQTYYYNGTYYLYDTSKPMNSSGGQIRTYVYTSSLPGSYSTDSNNNWNSSSQRAEVSAHYYAGLVYDYYYNTHGRNSYDGNGADLVSTAHYGTNYNNAYWNGSQMVYGDGDGSTFIALSGALDVVGHELTHAVTERTANLAYENQSGAINESMSDVFGAMIDRDDWKIGEDVYTPGVAGDALRDMQDPTMGIYDPNNPFGGGQPAHMDQYANLPNTQNGDYGGVHINSGIPNKAFYNVATSIGKSAAEKIYYRALTQYLTQYSNFDDLRNAVLQACSDLYGTTDGKYTAIQDAFAAVGIGTTGGGGGGGGGGTTDTYEPNNSTAEAYGPLTSGTVYRSYISSSSDVDYYYFTVSASGTATVNLANFPGDYDFFVYNSSGTEVARGYTTNDPENASFSVSSGTYYVKVQGYNGAYSTTDDYELTVTYPTGSGGGGTAQWFYETKTYDTPHNYPNYYDSYHEYSKPGAQKVAVHFSQFETEANYDFVYIYDKNGTQIAKYHGAKSPFWAVVDGDYIKVRLVSDYSVTKYGYHIDQVAYYATGQLLAGQPGSDVVGADSDPVDPNATKLSTFEVLGNFPNPFNPTTTLRFNLPNTEHVKVTIYNVNGQLVKTLYDGEMNAGLQKLEWDATNQTGQVVPSGIYLYRIQAGNQAITKKMMFIK